MNYQTNVIPYYQNSKIYIQASDAEGLSLSLIEAMVSGVVPIATIAGCEEDIITNKETGLLIPIGSPEAIAKAITYLLEDKRYNTIRNNILKSRGKFHVDNAISTCDKLIKNLFDL